MGLFKKILILSFLLTFACTQQKNNYERLPIFPKEANPLNSSSHALYLIQNNQFEKGLSYLIDNKPFLRSTLEEVSLAILQKGLNSTSKHDILLALHGAALSKSDRILYLLEKTIRHDDPNIQLATLCIASAFNHEQAAMLLKLALQSDYPLIRLEAAYILAQKHFPNAFAQISSLYEKIDDELKPLLAHIFAQEGSSDSKQLLRKMLYNPSDAIACETILACMYAHFDEFLDDITTQFNRHSTKVNEAIIMTLSEWSVKSDTALPKEPKLFIDFYSTQNNIVNYTKNIIKEAEDGNLYAFSLLGKLQEKTTLPFLLEKARSSDSSLAINATLALIHSKYCQPDILPLLEKVLFIDDRDIAFKPLFSPGRTTTAWQAIPSYSERYTEMPFILETSQELTEDTIEKIYEIVPKNIFLQFALHAVQKFQYHLIPKIMSLLSDDLSDDISNFLNTLSTTTFTPYIRYYAINTLERRSSTQENRIKIFQWLQTLKKTNVLTPRSILPWNVRLNQNKWALRVEERAELFLESLKTLAQYKDQQAVEQLLEIMRGCNSHNVYLIAGILLSISQ